MHRLCIVLLLFLLSSQVGCLTINVPCCDSGAGGSSSSDGWPIPPPTGLDSGTFDILQSFAGGLQDQLVGIIFVKETGSGRSVQHWIVATAPDLGLPDPSKPWFHADSAYQLPTSPTVTTCFKKKVPPPGRQYSATEYHDFRQEQWFDRPDPRNRKYARVVEVDEVEPRLDPN